MQNLVLPDDIIRSCVSYSGGCGHSECFPNTPAYALQYADWVAYGKPDCWCGPPEGSGYQCYGDTDGTTEGALKYRVSLKDLNLLIPCWKKRMSDMVNYPECPCADIDHKAEGALKYRVGLNDLNILIANWKKRDSALTPDCPHPD